ncbi:MAG: NAD(P)-dependent dehydrogenase (short-subunit alcohol dehydrogenase family), partial [Candidatus Binatia bacterium]
NERTGAETLELAKQAGHEGRIVFQAVDVSVEADVETMIARAPAEFGRLDIVFNNAGFPGALGKLQNIETEHWDRTFGVLVRGVFLGMKHAARVLLEQNEGGSIINTGSVAGLSGGCGPLAYSASKAAVVNLTRAAAVQMAKTGIRINSVCPGGILTPLVHRGNEAGMEKPMADSQPMPTAGRGTDIAAAVVYLASEDARFVTGIELVVDGGLTAAGPHVYRGEFETATGGGIDQGTIS